ncbi:hypothetical protein PV327_007746 [Microctonus hyperodae]|uniref:Uncharacterized protein n=1 Tax=Microctonus hyperodae TaxID=165561 RepID=A0AA39G0J5_MICHY|nr:hypothetical protein PV327_007746 [Microctonus hyperodae]
MYVPWCFNSVVLMLINFLVALYFGQRFFRVMRNHYKLVAEITEFNSIVRESRMCLDYTTAKVSEAMKEIENDIGEELNITHNLTKLKGQMSSLLAQFTKIEEEIIELVRMSSNMTSINTATPSDINSEVKKILRRKKNKLESPENKIIGDTFECLIRYDDRPVIG